MGRFWDKVREKELQRLWNSDKSSSQIADLWGITRSAVVGKVFRLRNKGMELRQDHETTRSHSSSKLRTRHLRAQRAAGNGGVPAHVKQSQPRETIMDRLRREAAMAPPIKVDPADIPRKTLLELADLGECKFAVGDHRPHMFCAAPSVPGASYCDMHMRRVFTGPPPERTGPAQPFILPFMHAKTKMPEGVD